MRRRRWLQASSFMIPETGTAIAWQRLGEPGHTRGLIIVAGVATALWPIITVAVVFGLPAAINALVPRSWRAAHRHRTGKRPHIPNMIRRAVFTADGWACRYCGNIGELQLDHVMPWACGGLSSLFNFVTLCGTCNKIKSNYWRYRSGHIVYRPFAGFDDEWQAAQILRVERRCRWYPWRWIIAAFAL